MSLKIGPQIKSNQIKSNQIKSEPSPNLDPPPNSPSRPPPPHRPSLNPPPFGAFGPLLLGGVAYKSEETSPPCTHVKQGT